MKLSRTASAACVLALLTASACTTPLPAADPATLVAAPGLETRATAMVAELVLAPASAEAFTARCDSAITLINEMVADLETRTTPAGAADLAYLDTLSAIGWSVGNGEAGLVSEANPDPAIRKSGEECIQKFSDVFSNISLSRPIYDRLVSIDLSTLSESEAAVLKRNLRDYRRSGVDKSEATRDKVRTLNTELSGISLEFNRNLREIQGSIKLGSVAELEGLPQDYIDAHPPGEDGRITITTDTPDMGPIFGYSPNESLRKRLLEVSANRAWPENEVPLRRLLEKRYELAQTLGYPNWAAYITEDKMTGAPEVAANFLSKIEAAGAEAARIEYNRLLEKQKQIDPAATTVGEWSSCYLSEQIRLSDYALDAQEVRQYFAYNNVRSGIFSMMEDLFGIEIRDWADAPAWHESVTAHEMYKDGVLVGRFFLDMHPRDGKFKHAAAFPIRVGPTRDGVPVASLMCNFPAGDHTTGLMEHREVETFLHEFGHLIHMMVSGHPEFATLHMGGLEWDFIEAPSQMLENWVWDYDTLATFAVNGEGETIPRELVEKMNAARKFGTGVNTLRQLVFAGVSLNFYNRPPTEVDFGAVWEERSAALSPFERLPDTHSYASFGHLDGYSAIYYTYQWSKAISTDLFTEFHKNGLRDKETSLRYRDLVLAKGSSKPAADLVRDFLGRDWTPQAYEQELIDAAKSE
ncbi:MAG: M3 family metallopeptidase [Hyphomonas sp.]|uniref:M3 family metallopeptidase n=1 Tax=Hyphomonas sp. TaxID=87 RepID=UPI0034A06A1B